MPVSEKDRSDYFDFLRFPTVSADPARDQAMRDCASWLEKKFGQMGMEAEIVATPGAPVVLAKGADLMAMRIRDAARAASVPVLQAPPLARALYAHAQVDREIPAALFAAVAQVLAWVYQLRNAMAGKGRDPGPLPELPVPAELDPHQADALRGRAVLQEAGK